MISNARLKQIGVLFQQFNRKQTTKDALRLYAEAVELGLGNITDEIFHRVCVHASAKCRFLPSIPELRDSLVDVNVEHRQTPEFRQILTDVQDALNEQFGWEPFDGRWRPNQPAIDVILKALGHPAGIIRKDDLP